MKKIKIISPKAKRIVDVGARQSALDPDKIAKFLGAERVPDHEVPIYARRFLRK